MNLDNSQNSQNLEDIQLFLDEIKRIRQDEEFDKETPRIKASLTISRLAFFYEKMRNTLEYKDEHLIIKSSLERILKRKFFTYQPGQPLAKSIIFELISGGYIANDSIPEYKISQVTQILDRYYHLFTILVNKPSRKLIVSLIACSIEEVLNKEVKEKEALVGYTHRTIKSHLLTDTYLDEYSADLQLYIAIHKILIKSDYQTIRYRLFKKLIPELENPTVSIHEVVLRFEDYERTIEGLLRDKARVNFLKFCRKVIPPYSLIGKMVAETPMDKIESSINQEYDFYRIAESSYSKWRDRAYSKIAKSAIRSVIFIFFTKMILAFIAEIPYDLATEKRVNMVPLLLNLMFPPLYMFLSTFNITVPGKENFDAIKDALRKIVFKTTDFHYQIKVKRKGSVKNLIFSLIYILTFAFSFSTLLYLLVILEFNIVAIILFFTFFSTVSFFAYRISRVSHELLLIRGGGGILGVLTDFFALPFIKLGQVLSSNFSRLNIFLFIFDFIIETPFKTLIEFLEEWVSFAKEKKEDIFNE